jgi:hypothetical protein
LARLEIGDCSLLDLRFSGLQVNGGPDYPVPQVVAIGLSAVVKMSPFMAFSCIDGGW